ncbi:MAG: hypothetical protein AVDCRST_MAG36-711, partial [uncultured Nocardioidaceae bacterium]
CRGSVCTRSRPGWVRWGRAVAPGRRPTTPPSSRRGSRTSPGRRDATASRDRPCSGSGRCPSSSRWASARSRSWPACSCS